ncbi:hypothetical protein ACEZ3G_16495 [Maribacter algicola]|uniref:Uncharacterized protein n=1 Tax=Meishania litoralis TaxID=3434685 RepID=A0ACC7LMV2_9FLAO
MTKLDPIIAVNDVVKSSKRYRSVFGCRSRHGGPEFDILVSDNDEVVLGLHKWGAYDHPTIEKPHNSPGNGLILYFITVNYEG